MTRAMSEATDLNDWFNCGETECSRLHFRTASFCNERSGHYDAFDQVVTQIVQILQKRLSKRLYSCRESPFFYPT
eukprot:SAG31_NODE_307_length_17957_cov_5.236645_4_plen_75_part_00